MKTTLVQSGGAPASLAEMLMPTQGGTDGGFSTLLADMLSKPGSSQKSTPPQAGWSAPWKPSFKLHPARSDTAAASAKAHATGKKAETATRRSLYALPQQTQEAKSTTTPSSNQATESKGPETDPNSSTISPQESTVSVEGSETVETQATGVSETTQPADAASSTAEETPQTLEELTPEMNLETEEKPIPVEEPKPVVEEKVEGGPTPNQDAPPSTEAVEIPGMPALLQDLKTVLAEIPTDQAPTAQELLQKLQANPETMDHWKNLDEAKALATLESLLNPPPASTPPAVSAFSLPTDQSLQGMPTAQESLENPSPKEKPTETVDPSLDQAQAALTNDQGEPDRPKSGGKTDLPTNSIRQAENAQGESQEHSESQGDSPSTFSFTAQSGEQKSPTAETPTAFRNLVSPNGELPRPPDAGTSGPAVKVKVTGLQGSFQPGTGIQPQASDATTGPRQQMGPSRQTDPLRSMLLSQIIEKAELFKTSEQHHTLTLQLKPEHLGKLDLELTTKDGTVTARISAESSLVREKLEQLLPQIKEHLAQQGVNLGQITVDVSSHQPDDRRREARPEKNRATARIGQEDPSAAEASRDVLPALRRMALNISRVDLTV